MTKWLHLGAGNIFRAFLAAVAQDMLDAGLDDPHLAVCECYDEEIIPAVFTPYDNKTLGVTLHTDGRIATREISAVRTAFGRDAALLAAMVAQPALQLISLTITEKGYVVDAAKIAHAPHHAATTLEYLTAALLARFTADAPPLAVVTMDNFAANGSVLHQAIQAIADAWENNGNAPQGFTRYIDRLAFPWTMIDKITPHPSPQVAAALDYPHKQITTTAKGTTIAPFVNAEAAQYLVMEDNFPNGRPPFHRLPASGVYLTDRETVRKADHMKVCACLNPLHTLLGIGGMLLRYPTIAACMQDETLVALARQAAEEALPVVETPGIIDPRAFLHEVLTRRFPNPHIPDTPHRITTDSSQKIPIRFGQTLLARQKANLPAEELSAIPTLIALWLRYRLAIADDGRPLTLAPDPLCPPTVTALANTPLGQPAAALNLRPILSDARLFGVDLYEAGLGECVERMFRKLAAKPGTLRELRSRD